MEAMNRHIPDFNARKSYAILTFGGILALCILLMLEIQRFTEVSGADRRFARVSLPSANVSIFGRRLPSGQGDYFLDIPYAFDSPRFEPANARNLSSLSEFYAIHYGNGCPNGYYHSNLLKQRVYSPEMCQQLSVYRCNFEDLGQMLPLIPVLVYVNDGAWWGRSDNVVHPESAIRRVACLGSILVTVNYRMGPYGFFPANKSSASPALNDLENAFRWVRQNIEPFGGDPARITVMAKGVGAQMVSAMSMRDEFKDLFHQLILLDGSSYAPTTFKGSYANGPNISKLSDVTRRTNFSVPFDAAAQFLNASGCAAHALRRENVTELDTSMEEALRKCLRDIPMATIESIEAKAIDQPSAFVRWPLAFLPSTNAATLRSLPIIMGTCRFGGGKNSKVSPSTASALGVDQLELLRRDLVQRLAAFGDLGRLGYADAVLKHYSMEFVRRRPPLFDRLPKEREAQLKNLLEKIRTDFLVDGPMLLEAYERAVVTNASVYFFQFEAPRRLNRSMVDIVSRNGEETNFARLNATTSTGRVSSDQAIFAERQRLQQVCVDDLLFNPLDDDLAGASDMDTRVLFMRARHSADTFAQLLANFVAYGNPTPDVDGGGKETAADYESLKWPRFATTPPLTSANSNESVGAERPPYDDDRNKVLRIGASGGPNFYVDNHRSMSSSGRRFWLCEMAPRLRAPLAFCDSQMREEPTVMESTGSGDRGEASGTRE